MPLNWLEEIKGVNSIALTVQAQALGLDDIDPAGMLQAPVFMPPTDTDSVDLQTIYETDYRPVADRREWNAPGRYIGLELPELKELSMVPIEAENRLNEKEMQKLTEASLGGNEAVFRRLLAATIPQRVDMLVAALYRRSELDAMEAWAKGTITGKNPTNGSTAFTLSLGFDSGRLQTAATAWDDPSVNAWNELLAWIEDGEAEMGPIVAVKLRRATFNAIQEDAPNILDYGGNAIRATRSQVQDRVGQELGHAFRFIISEEQVDVFSDGGTAYTRTAVWPANYIAAVPATGQIGATYRAPVVRAAELARQFPDAGVDVRGATVYYQGLNDDKHAKVQAQANWLALPFERNVWTINAGV
jgi:hypothetical protein